LKTSGRVGRHGDESYAMRVAHGGIRIRARTATGFFYATQTLRQLFPLDIFSPSVVTGTA
jgi:hexosaminidase